MIRVTVEFLGLPNAAKLAGAKSFPLELPGGTIADLVQALADRHGEPLRRLLLDDEGRLDLSFQVIHNKTEWLRREQLDRPLGDGDVVTITMLVGGG
jgi:hypothetical protein